MKVELLAPAGDLEKLKTAVLYGADAVYMGGTSFSLRAKAKNFDEEQMKEGIDFAHSHGVKVYITCNIYAHNEDIDKVGDYLVSLEKLGADAVLISDLGVFAIAREVVPNLEIHISTQANNTNYRSAKFWLDNGAKRIVMARELSVKEIKELHNRVPEAEIESFVHGAMCISYSGRCLLSNYLTGRDANAGACSHPCRWEYFVSEKTRPGEYMPIVEEERGTYIFNSKDLCMIEHIPELIDAGVYSFKLEGRMKTPFYVATVTSAYRKAIDDYLEDPQKYESNKQSYVEAVSKASYRGFTTGFYYGKPTDEDQVYTTSAYIRNYDFVGLVKKCEDGFITVEQRNKFSVGDDVEIIQPSGNVLKMTINEMYDEEGDRIESAPHAQQSVKIKTENTVEYFSMIRREAE